IGFDMWWRHGIAITATVGGLVIGSGLDLTDRRVAWITGIVGAAVGALLGLSMWITGPGRRIAKWPLWIGGSVALVLMWWFLALAACVVLQKLLALATGGWDVTPSGALLGGAVGLVIGGVAEELWWQHRRMRTSSARGEAEPSAAADRPRE